MVLARPCPRAKERGRSDRCHRQVRARRLAIRIGMANHRNARRSDAMQYECPHCEALIQQTKENRQKHRIQCDKCKKEFSTQWAEKEEDKALPKAAVVSERFEVARNFCNKLWNASRFVMMNLGDFKPGPIDRKSLPLEDRWILSKLSSTTSKSLSCSWNLSMPKQPGWLMSSRGATSAAITSKSPSHGCKMPMPRHWFKRSWLITLTICSGYCIR